MSEAKTKLTDQTAEDFLNSIEHEKRREDAQVVADIMARVTGKPARMWGSAIIGFDTYQYQYESGKIGDWMITGLSPRKSSLSVYIMPGFDAYADKLAKLGKYKTGKSCLYIYKLEDVDLDVLEELIAASVEDMRKKYPR